MNSFVTRINHILQQEDIEGLIEAGAPSDEYASEADAIAKMITNLSEQNRENLENAIYTYWEEVFNLSADEMILRREAIQRVTVNILSESK